MVIGDSETLPGNREKSYVNWNGTPPPLPGFKIPGPAEVRGVKSGIVLPRGSSGLVPGPSWENNARVSSMVRK